MWSETDPLPLGTWMPTYLLKWDATKWDWRNLTEQAEAVRNGIPVSRTWTCGSNRKVANGDRVFVIRLGREPRGIVGAGRVTRGAYQSPGLEQQDGARATSSFHVELRFDALFEPRREAMIPRPALSQGALGSFMWDVNASGIQVPDAVAAALEQLWEERVDATGASPTKVAADKAAADRAAAEQAAAEKAAAEKLAAEKTAAEKAAAEKVAAEKVAAEKAAAEKAAAAKAAAGKAAAEKAAAEQAAAEKAAAAKSAAQKAAVEKAAADQAAAAKREADEATAKAAAERARADAERMAAEKAALERKVKERGAREARVAAPAAAPAPSAPRPAMYPAIVADHFAMLADELRGAMYSKADHRARLGQQLGVDDADIIDVAHQQISSVLLQLGVPVIDGFRPLGGAPALLRSAVHEWLEGHAGDVEALELGGDASTQPVPVELDDSRSFHVPMPPRGDADEEPAPDWSPKIALDLDFRGREQRDERLAVAGQRFVLAFERARLREAGRKDLVGRIEWVAQDRGDSLGFHVRSFEDDGRPRHIIVKTTNYGARFPFGLTARELAASRDDEAKVYLYRVFAFMRGAKLWMVAGPLDGELGLTASEYLAVV